MVTQQLYTLRKINLQFLIGVKLQLAHRQVVIIIMIFLKKLKIVYIQMLSTEVNITLIDDLSN